MAEGEGTPTTPKQEKEAQQSKPWPLRERLGKTNWDWLQLFIVPLLILFLTVAFTWYQNVRQNQREDERVQQAQKIENQRAEAERELVVQRAQDEALQAYLNQMTDLLLEKNLRESKQDSELRILAQARTATVMQTLDVDGNRTLIRFLEQARLTGDLYGENPSAISLLSETDLTGARLQGLDLQNVDLHGTILDDADLRGTSPVWMVEASLIGADMRRIYLEDANLNYAIMDKADLRDAVLLNANFIGASLIDADLRGTNLKGAYLDKAVLSEADLTNAKIRQEQIDKIAALDGATMPNGQKYEDWLKDRKGHGKVGENPDSS